MMQSPEIRLDTEPTHERKVYGRVNIAEIPVRYLVCLPQVRKSENTEFDELKESIKAQDLLQLVSVAMLTEKELQTYLDFLNYIWEAKVEISNYQHLRQDDMYSVVIAGHSRTKALQQIDDEDSEHEVCATVNVHRIADPLTLLGIQVSENIHSQPDRSRRAMAIDGAYRRGVNNGEWGTVSEFRKKSGNKLSPHVLREAIAFAGLPAEARRFVFEGEIPYSVGVELGLATETTMQYVVKKIHEDPSMPNPTPEDFDTAYRLEVVRLITEIKRDHLNVKRSRDRIRSRVKGMDRYVNPDGYIPQALFTIEQIQESYLEKLQKDYENAIRTMARVSITSVAPVIELADKLKNGEADRYVEEYRERETKFSMLFGQLAVADAEPAAA